mgnify:CR=1 FL=1
MSESQQPMDPAEESRLLEEMNDRLPMTDKIGLQFQRPILSAEEEEQFRKIMDEKIERNKRDREIYVQYQKELMRKRTEDLNNRT